MTPTIGNRSIPGIPGKMTPSVVGVKRAAASGTVGAVEMVRALAALVESPSPALRPVADALDVGPLPPPAVHTDLFDLQLYPFASVYLSAEGMLGGEARDRIAGFWRAVGAEPPAEPDHLAALLGGLASLLEAAPLVAGSPADPQAEHARRAFFNEHIASWLPAWLASLERLCAADDRRAFYCRWGRLLDATLRELRVSAPAPDALPIHLRALPPLADPREKEAEAFLAGVLTPAVSGMILVRDDLARCALDLGLGLRHGERRFVLRALLGQNAPATLGWLAEEATRQATSLVCRGVADQHWRDRAVSTSRLLRTLTSDSFTVDLSDNPEPANR